MRYCITFSYDGAPFSGYQVQTSAPSVQEALQKSLSTLLREDIQVTGAGRTDSKVNAVRYVAHFDFEGDGLTESFVYKINAILPREITVHEVMCVSGDFHARFSARCRTYKYFLHRGKDPFAARFSYRCPYTLDVEKMNRAAAMIVGKGDFSCFEKTGGNNATSICTVYEAHWDRYTPTHVGELDFPCTEGDYLVFTISADRFLRNMVRSVVGTLMDIGRGRHDESWISEVLSSHDRSHAGESVPGHALFLCGIRYPEELYDPLYRMGQSDAPLQSEEPPAEEP